MGYFSSPGIRVNEIDATTSVPATATTVGAIAGVFNWGPVGIPVILNSEENLKRRFDKPSDTNAETWFSAADFLSYTGSLWVVRVVGETAANAGTTNQVVSNAEQAAAIINTPFVARHPGAIANGLEVSVVTASSYEVSDLTGMVAVTGERTATFVSVGALKVGDFVRIGTPRTGFQYLTVDTVSGTIVTFAEKIRIVNPDNFAPVRFWNGHSTVGNIPATGNLHILVIDREGKFSGVRGSVLEAFADVSPNPDSRTTDGASNFYKEVVNKTSQFIWATGDSLVSVGESQYLSLTGGNDGESESDIGIDRLAEGYDLFRDKNSISYSLLISGKSRGEALAEHQISIVEDRKDAVVFLSPPRSLVVNNIGNEAVAVVEYVSGLTPSSYAMMDSAYKYRYDKYNDKFIYTPLNGDIAGLVARTDETRDPWIAPAGYNRGGIKNVIRLSFNPNNAERDLLYPANVNPVISEAGEGTILYGDKTMYGDGSAFSRIGVRRLFIVIKQSLEKSLKATLWEQNDEYTRAAFRNRVDPYLRDIQGRRGITAFKTVCDATNNTPEVIDRNEFIADIYVKPSRSISYITLNVTAVRSGVEFSEIVGG